MGSGLAQEVKILAQEVKWVDLQPEGCSFDPRLLLTVSVPRARRLTPTVPDELAVALLG